VQTFAGLIGLLYLLVVLGLALYGLHNLVTTLLYLRGRKTPRQVQSVSVPETWPLITIQLPIFNEKYTVGRLLRSITQLDYPAGRLQIQVLDDSTDDTQQMVEGLVKEYAARGANIQLIHRSDRSGYKAGALDNGMKQATGEFIGIFDADFIPAPDWLRRTVPLFENSRIGCLQTRWGHTNRRYNLLTRAEAMGIDGHFLVEQTARSEYDFFMNFNGTAGLWRKACIDDAGGWQWDTLTEDLDLSYRAQIRGWKIDYLPDVVVPAELPAEVEAYKKQQFRWAKGSFQVVKKILPQIFGKSKLPLHIRLFALFHITGYVVHPLMLLLLLLTLPVGLLVPGAFKIFPISALAGFGPPLLYLVATGSQTPRFHERVGMLPLLIITGFGISLSTSIAVIEGLLGKGSTVFTRTPKLNLGDVQDRNKSIDVEYTEPISPMVWAEIGLGLYALLTMFVLEPYVGWGIIPWMAIYAIGFFYIAGLNLVQHRFGSVPPKAAAQQAA
jgi:cellulose synthase/poly-beta-1,6-N-acetylglucosamine synthase-like glycosyltransferase